MKKILLILLTSFSHYGFSQDLATGTWRGEIIYDQVTVPFEFVIDKIGGEYNCTIINGEERKRLEVVTVTEDSVWVQLDVFDAELRAKYTSQSMSGNWIKHYRNSKIPFKASLEAPRYSNDLPPNFMIKDPWEVTFSPPNALAYPGVGLWKQTGSRVSGTIMTGVSDFRYFEGIAFGDSIELSSFDGAHAFLLQGVKTAKGWEGAFHFDNSYIEDWSARPNPEANLTDPWELVKVDKGKHRPFFDILSAGSKSNKIDESDFFGKVLVIQLFGTWCPNSLDQSRFLSDWYQKNKDRDVEILAVSYETNFSESYGLSRIESYKKSLDIEYPMVLGGRLSKSQAAIGFPFMKKIEAFPTLVVLDKDGYVRYVHSYFNGPATGKYYDQFVSRFNSIIDELEAE